MRKIISFLLLFIIVGWIILTNQNIIVSAHEVEKTSTELLIEAGFNPIDINKLSDFTKDSIAYQIK